MKRLVPLAISAIVAALGPAASTRGQGPAAPAWFSRAEVGRATAEPDGMRAVVASLPRATEERARADVRRRLAVEVRGWLGPDAPPGWEPSEDLVGSLVIGEYVAPIAKDYGTLHVAAVRADLSEWRKAPFLEARAEYDRERLFRRIGGLLAFVLAALAVVAGYIRTDEATRGYYTNRLRMLAAAALGAAGFAAYRLIA